MLIMKYLSFIILAAMVIACTDPKTNTVKETHPESAGHAAYEQVFKEVDSLLRSRSNSFWQTPLYGPILLIDPETRAFTANQNNAGGSFQKKGNVYTDTLPKDLNIANTAISWDGELWTMVMTPLPTDKNSRNNLIIHELFHRIQDTIGFKNLKEAANNHLDTYNGRLLLKLELEALKKAVIAESKKELNLHLENAMNFRIRRQNDFEASDAENTLEINEGLAEYTGAMLSGRNEQDMMKHLIGTIDDFYSNKTFVRSFAYQTIPAYGYLLSKVKPYWHRDIDRETNLTDYFIQAFGIKSDSATDTEALAKAHDYRYFEIKTAESERETKRLAQLEAYKSKFLNDTVLTLSFENMNIAFDPRNITPLEEHGTVYPNLKVTDNWGVLTVEKGALLSPSWNYVKVSTPERITKDTVFGDGWQLALKPGWVVKGKEGKYSLEKN